MVYILLGNGFEEIEAVAVEDILRRAGISVQLVGIGGSVIPGAHGIRVEADITLEDLETEHMDMIVLPGGMGGVSSIENSDTAMAAIRYAVEHDKYVAAICAGPMVLGRQGWLEKVHAVCYPGCETALDGAIVHPECQTVSDGKIITGRAPGAAIDFGLALVEALLGPERAREISLKLVYRQNNEVPEVIERNVQHD